MIEPRGLVVADTNWGDGDHMKKFSMVANPLTDPAEIEMWQMNEDGTSASKMDQKKWSRTGRCGPSPTPRNSAAR